MTSNGIPAVGLETAFELGLPRVSASELKNRLSAFSINVEPLLPYERMRAEV